jgi:signal peptidase II
MQTKKIKINIGKISFIMMAVFAVLLATDLITKECAVKYEWNFIVIKNFIEVVPVQLNSGAAFSFLYNKEWGQAFFIAVTVVMLVPLIAAFIFLPERFIVLKLALAMVIAGAVGNLVDRIAFQEVRDFVWVNMLGKWACCNFADFWIVFGVAIAVIDMLFFNEWSVFPLTKKARAAQEERAKREEENSNSSKSDDAGENDGEDKKE